tara:strand:- start:71 stop:274 length:204 start_codon:yes stop_codon:yes gene_type:complete
MAISMKQLEDLDSVAQLRYVAAAAPTSGIDKEVSEVLWKIAYELERLKHEQRDYYDRSLAQARLGLS